MGHPLTLVERSPHRNSAPMTPVCVEMGTAVHSLLGLDFKEHVFDRVCHFASMKDVVANARKLPGN